MSAILALLALSSCGLASAASTPTADGYIVVGIPDGWKAAETTVENEVLRLEGGSGFLSLRRPQANPALMRRGINGYSAEFEKKGTDAGSVCKASVFLSTAMPNGAELMYKQVECEGLKTAAYFGAFPFGEHAYFFNWYVETKAPFAYGIGVVALLQKAEKGPDIPGWQRSAQGDVMVPVPVGGWENFTSTKRAVDDTTVAHFTLGPNFMDVQRLPMRAEASLALLAQSEAEREAPNLGKCAKAGSGKLSLKNGWTLHGLAAACDGPQGKRTFSFGAFRAKDETYSLFGVYDKAQLDASVGAAILASEAGGPGEMVAVQEIKEGMPPLVQWIILASVPFGLTLILLVFRRRKPVVEAPTDADPPAAA